VEHKDTQHKNQKIVPNWETLALTLSSFPKSDTIIGARLDHELRQKSRDNYFLPLSVLQGDGKFGSALPEFS